MRKFFWFTNEHLEMKVENFFKMLEYYNQTEFDGKVSMLLLGSMSRGEASWKTINGVDTIVSDIEMLTLLPKGFTKFSRLHEVFDEAKSKCFSDQHSVLFHIDYGMTGGHGYDMSKMERKLLTFDANAYAYTVVGRDYKHTLPAVNYFNINMQDIWEIMVHRVFSLLYWGKPLKEAGRTEEYRYNIAKNSLDLMTVLLVNHGMLVSGFANRLNAIKGLDLPDNIKQYFECCLSIKSSTDCQYSYTTEEMERFFIGILEEQNKTFVFHRKNFYCNIKMILRRHAGQIKRALSIRHIPCTQKKHLQNMAKLFKENSPLKEKNLRDNFVLNGYPTL